MKTNDRLSFQRVSLRLAAAFVLFSLFSVSTAFAEEGWWNEAWNFRREITFNTTETGAGLTETLTDVPVLIRLHPGNFDFANARQDGEDLRFVAADDKTLLKHHIDRFDPIDEIGLIWVKVPRLAANSTQERMFVYYGNPAAAGAQDAQGTFDLNQMAVWHFKETEGPPQDATAYGNHASSVTDSQGLPSVIGNGFTFNGAGDSITVPHSPSLVFPDGFTISGWVRTVMAQDDAAILMKGDENRHLTVGIRDGGLYCEIALGEGKTIVTETPVEIPPESWRFFTVTASPTGDIRVFLDGREAAVTPFDAKIPDFPGDLSIGASTAGDRFFGGDLDEIMIANVPRPAAWVQAAFAAQGPGDTLYGLGVEIQGGSSGGLPVFYLKTIFKNITLDGWIIIGLLLLLGLIAWIVFLTKALMLFIMSRANKSFIRSFEEAQELMGIYKNGDDYGGSPLFRVYRHGCERIEHLNHNPTLSCGERGFTTRAMNAIRASLERGFIEESKRLNAYLVVLTMSISGGPFLGLLGTVWGVMNTFAAMAEAGEANIMAIAPGVASALSTTVFGLIVAIPALFGYNYLTGKIKGMTADLTVFVDQFAVMADETGGGV